MQNPLLPQQQVAPLEMPPGHTGYIAEGILQGSYIPQQEISIIATLALLSGIAGRAYRTPTGATLSQYYLLIGNTGCGKETIHTALPTLLHTYGSSEAVRQFLCMERFASGVALHQRILQRPGFLALHPEFGKRLSAIASERSGSHEVQFAAKMTEAYEKSYMEGITRANPDNCVEGVEWPCLSFLGETTPRVFYDCLTEEMMESGFFSRFLTVEVSQERPLYGNPYQPYSLQPETGALLKDLINLSNPNTSFQGSAPAITVGYGEQSVIDKMNNFEAHCSRRINEANSKQDTFGAATWNRAHLKVLKLASLLAVIDNPKHPAIVDAHFDWALMAVERDAHTFLHKVDTGDVGSGEDVLTKKIESVITKIIQGSITDVIDGKEYLHRQDYVFSRRKIQANTGAIQAFKRHRLGATKAMDLTLDSMVANGYIQELPKDLVAKAFGNETSKLYMLQRPLLERVIRTINAENAKRSRFK